MTKAVAGAECFDFDFGPVWNRFPFCFCVFGPHALTVELQVLAKTVLSAYVYAKVCPNLSPSLAP